MKVVGIVVVHGWRHIRCDSDATVCVEERVRPGVCGEVVASQVEALYLRYPVAGRASTIVCTQVTVDWFNTAVLDVDCTCTSMEVGPLAAIYKVFSSEVVL